jgi:hypothetical protein
MTGSLTTYDMTPPYKGGCCQSFRNDSQSLLSVTSCHKRNGSPDRVTADVSSGADYELVEFAVQGPPVEYQYAFADWPAASTRGTHCPHHRVSKLEIDMTEHVIHQLLKFELFPAQPETVSRGHDDD